MILETGKRIGRYEIRSLLGAGGMGEVYAAFDKQMGRSVALKLLKKSEDHERLRRFRQEAKAVTALNHPNILTVHDFGQYEGFHYIVTELIKGETLRQKITHGNLSLDEILDIGIQIGNALAAAHQTGVVHRDIKPENIMVLPDGYVKVLDFGLAKLLNFKEELAEDLDASTASLINTRAGMILGTVNYMSPEQLRGQPLDERTDIWSLGVVLYEMLMGHCPFLGETISDVIAVVLKSPLPSMTKRSPPVPPKIETVVGKALKKDLEERYQSVPEFVMALKDAKFYTDSESRTVFLDDQRQLKIVEPRQTAATKEHRIQTLESPASPALIFGKAKKNWFFASLAGFFILLAVGGWFYGISPLLKNSAPPKERKVRRLTTAGNVLNAVISPDGRFIAYVQEEDGKQSLWLKQASETAGKELIAADFKSYGTLNFAPDGNWIYFTVFGQNSIGTLYRIPILGVSPQKIAADVDSSVSFSPAGKQIAFIRKNSSEGIDRIIISDTDGNNARTLSERKLPAFYSFTTRESLAWSPDGRTIACAAGKQDASGEQMTVVEVDTENGAEHQAIQQNWSRVGKIIWGKEKRELIITAADFGTEAYQIVRLDLAGGKTEKVTNELSDYLNVSLSADRKYLLAVVNDRVSNIFKAASENFTQTAQIARSNSDGANGLVFTPDEKILFVSMESGNWDIWKSDADGKNRLQLTFDKASDDYPAISADGRFIVFVSTRTGVSHIWRMKADGSEQRQLTNKGGESFPQITADGNFVIYSARTEGRPVLWKVSIEGGEPAQLTSERTHWAAISPDGKLIACLAIIEDAQNSRKLAVVSAKDGNILQTFDPLGSIADPKFPPVIRWTPDGKVITYVSTSKGISNIWAQPLAGDKPRKLTDFSADRIFSFDWSRDGKQVIYARGSVRNDIILFEDF